MKDLIEILVEIQKASVPNLFVVAGFVFILLAFVGKFGAIIVLPPSRQKWAGIVGLVLLGIGIVLFILPNSLSRIMASNASTSPTTSVPQPTKSGSLVSYKDNFEDTTFEGTINRAFWGVVTLTKNCKVAQHNGALVLSGNPSDKGYYCVLTVGNPSAVGINELGKFQARMKISEDHGTGWLETSLRWFKCCGSPGGDSETSCGLSVTSQGIQINFSQEGYEMYADAEADRWYDIRLEIDPETLLISCYVDDKLFASSTPRNLEAWKSSTFRRDFNTSFYESTSFGTVSIDDLSILPKE